MHRIIRPLLLLASVGLTLPTLASASPPMQTPPPPKPKVSAPTLLAGGPGSQGAPSLAGNTMVFTSCPGVKCDVRGADLTTRQAYTLAEGAWDEAQPVTDGYRVVWRDGRNTDIVENRTHNADIYWASLDDKRALPVTRAVKMQNRPSIWGNIAVWADFREARSGDDQESGDVYMFDLAAGKETLISNARSAQVRPTTNGKVVVWVDYRHEPTAEGANSALYGYDISTKGEFLISNAPDTQTDPAISGNTVVWADYRKGDDTADIYGYDLATKQEFAIATAKGSQVRPAISGNIVVWEDYRNEPDQKEGADADIYGYDLLTKQEFVVFRGPGTQGVPGVSGGIVAWEDTSKGKDDHEIMSATVSGVTIAASTPPPPALPVGAGSRAYAETGKTVSGLFLEYWDKSGGLPQQGYPISALMGEVSDLNGKPYAVQYFERAVFEFHPENPAPYNVLLSQLGTFQYKKKYPAGAPNQQPNTGPGSQLFPETGKRVGGPFLAYWQKNGGLQQQGYPISEEFMEKSDLDGKTYRVQYFERAVFELHPENPAPYDVLLSQLGTFQHKAKYEGK